MNAQSVKTETRTINDSTYIDLVNPTYAPIEFRLSIKPAYIKYFKADSVVVIPPKSSLKNVVRYPSTYSIDSSKTILDFVDLKGNYGSRAGVIPDAEYRYLLPYPIGKSYYIIQGNKGSFSHNLPHSKYAIDFALQIGDTITAARSGQVILVKEDSKEYGPTRNFTKKANQIIVMHDDGTFAYYVHLDYNQVFVEEGMMIEAGQPIGLSGLTGFTTKPHLHFVVMRDRGISIPIKFKGVKKQVPEQGKHYLRKK